MLDLRRLHEPLHSLGEDEEAYEEEEEAVDESCEDLGPDVSIAKLFICPPLGDDGGCEAGEESSAVKEHVEGVGDESK